MENIFGKPVEFTEEEIEPTIDETIEYFKNFALEHKTGLIILFILMCISQIIDKIF